MLRFLSDVDFRGSIVRGLLQNYPRLDIVRAQDVSLAQKSDAELLEWAAPDRGIVLSHDSNTMPSAAHARVLVGHPMPGLIIVRQTVPTGRALQDLRLMVECSFDEEWESQVRYIPI
jgi:hypothetical protein